MLLIAADPARGERDPERDQEDTPQPMLASPKDEREARDTDSDPTRGYEEAVDLAARRVPY